MILQKDFFVEKFIRVSILVTEYQSMLSKRTNIRLAAKAVRGKMKKLGITEEDVGEAIQWARNKKKRNKMG
jgi:hypothetical protein